MKIALRFVLAVVLGALPLLTLLHLVQERRTEAQSASVGLGAQVAWPAGERYADPEVAAGVLGDAARSVGHNLLRTVVATAPGGTATITHYILLVTPMSQLEERVPLSEGRWPDTWEWGTGAAHIGSGMSRETGADGAGDDQSPATGYAAELGAGYRVSVWGLDRVFRRVPAAGSYILEGAGTAEADRFRTALADGLRERTGVSVPESEFTPRRSDGVATVSLDPLTLVEPVGLIAAILASALVVRTARSFGVLRLHGYSGARLWLRVGVYPLVPASILATAVIGALGLSFPGMTGDDVLELAGVQLGATTGVLVIASGVTWLVLVRLDIPALVKGAVQ